MKPPPIMPTRSARDFLVCLVAVVLFIPTLVITIVAIGAWTSSWVVWELLVPEAQAKEQATGGGGG